MPNDLALSIAVSLFLFGVLIYRGIEYCHMRWQMRRRADLLYHWAMAIGRRIDWSKVPPIRERSLPDAQIVEAHIQPGLFLTHHDETSD